jgi:hypothetical protein
MNQTDLVELVVERSSSDSALQTWTLVYPGISGRDASFELDIGAQQPTSSGDFSVARGLLRAGDAHAPTTFLEALADALEAGSDWPDRPAAREIALDVGVLGDSLARGIEDREGTILAGEFTDARLGPWLLTKLFLKEGEAEVFLALAATERRGLLIMKDPEYGRDVVAEFARLFR